ncbi:MAG: hypothetical protein QNJ46_00165 [Leptolyngbyaceae cyanobacterium MO_188.B28]|nr:hypothetical protein [Leptolyngbyaceae cyanobacterium MO_188.B28]
MASLPSLKPLLQTFRQPTWLAVFTSAGIHGVLFAASPSFSSSALTSWTNPGAWNRPHTVPLVELTPEEQGRLPNFSNQSFLLSPDLNQGDALNLPTTTPPNLPNPFSRNLPSNGLPQDWQEPSTFIQTLPPLSTIPTTLPPFGSLTNPTSSPYPNPLPLRQPIPPTPLQRSIDAPTQSPETASSTNNQPTPPSNPSNQTQPAANVAPARRLPRFEPDNFNNRVTDLDGLQTDSELHISVNLDPGAQENEPTQQDAGIQTNLSFNAPERESIRDRLDGYAYKAELTSEEAAKEAIAVWTADVQVESAVEDLQPQLTELPAIKNPIENPVRVCLPQASASAMIGILISPDGQIMGQPKLLKSTGYAVLNNWAAQSLGQALAENPELLPGDSYQALQFEIPIKYGEEICVDPNQLTQTQNQTEQPNDQSSQ